MKIREIAPTGNIPETGFGRRGRKRGFWKRTQRTSLDVDGHWSAVEGVDCDPESGHEGGADDQPENDAAGLDLRT